ncbi:MAG TPA: hypothetical protein V6D37_18545 [Candidatus Sericytochromatia bacterium]
MFGILNALLRPILTFCYLPPNLFDIWTILPLS